MANFDMIRHARRKRKKVRVTFTLSQEAFDELLLLSEQEVERSASSIAADCIRFAYLNRIYERRNDRIDEGIVPRVESPKLPKKTNPESKAEWCIKYGGRMESNTCYYQKYERALTGELYRSEQGMPLTQMPSQEDDFRKVILGNFMSVSQAEFEYEKSKGDELEPVKMLPMKKK